MRLLRRNQYLGIVYEFAEDESVVEWLTRDVLLHRAIQGDDSLYDLGDGESCKVCRDGDLMAVRCGSCEFS